MITEYLGAFLMCSLMNIKKQPYYSLYIKNIKLKNILET